MTIVPFRRIHLSKIATHAPHTPCLQQHTWPAILVVQCILMRYSQIQENKIQINISNLLMRRVLTFFNVKTCLCCTYQQMVSSSSIEHSRFPRKLSNGSIIQVIGLCMPVPRPYNEEERELNWVKGGNAIDNTSLNLHRFLRI